MDSKTFSGYFVCYRGSGYGPFLAIAEAEARALQLVKRNQGNYRAIIKTGSATIENRKLKRSHLNTVKTVPVFDFAYP